MSKQTKKFNHYFVALDRPGSGWSYVVKAVSEAHARRQVCGCGAWRFHTVVTPFNGKQPATYFGKWQGKENPRAPEPWEL